MCCKWRWTGRRTRLKSGCGRKKEDERVETERDAIDNSKQFPRENWEGRSRRNKTMRERITNGACKELISKSSAALRYLLVDDGDCEDRIGAQQPGERVRAVPY